MADEILDMEKIAEREALKQRIESARLNIERQRGDMAQSTTNAAGEVGMVKSLWNVMQERQGKIRELAWKDLKATAAGALSVIPLVGEAGTLVKLGAVAEKGKHALSAEKAFKSTSMIGDLGDAALVSRNTARREFWNALKNVPRNPVHLVSDPLHSGKEALSVRKALKDLQTSAKSPIVVSDRLTGAATTLENVRKGKITDAKTAYSAAKKQFGKDVLIGAGLEVMHEIDPFPDVPPTLTTIARLAEFVLPGANILPALWQLGHNKIEWAKTYGGMALDMGKVVMNRFDRKLNGMRDPQVARAAAAFHHG